MAHNHQYFLGHSAIEQRRLQQQAGELADESARLFDQIGLAHGSRVVEIGCGPQGCLELLSRRVGPTGSVIGIELTPAFAGQVQDSAPGRSPPTWACILIDTPTYVVNNLDGLLAAKGLDSIEARSKHRGDDLATKKHRPTRIGGQSHALGTFFPKAHRLPRFQPGRHLGNYLVDVTATQKSLSTQA